MSYQLGDCVYTSFGCGVIVGKRVNDEDVVSFLHVLLWRQSGKSIATTATAILTPSAIQRALPVAPGMLVTMKQNKSEEQSFTADGSPKPRKKKEKRSPAKILIHAYHPSTDEFTISRVKKEQVRAPAPETLIDPLPVVSLERLPSSYFLDPSFTVTSSAHLYALLLGFIEHADKATAATQQLLTEDSTQTLLLHAEQTVKSGVDQLLSSNESPTRLIKDEQNQQELQDFLQQCQGRLQDLVSRTKTEVSTAAQQALDRAGIRVASNDEDITNSQAAMANEALQALRTKDLAGAWEALEKAAASDRVLSSWMTASSELLPATTQRVLQTRSARLAMESAGRLQQRAAAMGPLFAAGTGQAEQMARQLGDAVLAGGESSWDHIIAHLLPPQLLKQVQSVSTTSLLDTLFARQSIWREQALCHVEQALLDHIPWATAAGLLGKNEDGTSTPTSSLLEALQGNRPPTEILESLLQSKDDESSASSPIKGLHNAVDGFVNVLNNEKVVAAGESFVQSSEYVLDALESTAPNVMDKAVEWVGNAEVHDRVVREIQNVDWRAAVSDAQARQQLIASATDAALDFCLRILPSLPVPPLEGVRDGLVYQIANLSMKGFHVKKETIHLQLAGITATTTTPRNVAQEQSQFAERGDSFDSFSSNTDEQAGVNANEVLIIDIHDIAALLQDAKWSFEQTYLPYLKGSGKATVRLSGGSIRLQFELRKRKVVKQKGEQCWEPVLCLHDRHCEIENVELTMDGTSRLTWVVNKLAAIFKGPLRDYVVANIVKVLSTKSGWLLQRLNGILSPYWDLILKTTQLELDDLLEADDNVIVMEESEHDGPATIELVWRERLPLGMNLLMNDTSGGIKIVDFPRGSQARTVCEKRGFPPSAFEGASIVAVNGTSYEDEHDLFEALKEPGRPKSVAFVLAENEEAERLRNFISLGEEKKVEEEAEPSRSFGLREAIFSERGELGIEFGVSPNNGGLTVKGFLEGEGGIVLAAERDNQVHVGDLLTHVNSRIVISVDGMTSHTEAIEMLQTEGSTRPLRLAFCQPFLHSVCLEKPPHERMDESLSGGPEELILEQQTTPDGSRRVCLRGFNNINGAAEAAGILLGDHLVFVNGDPVGIGCQWLAASRTPSLAETDAMLRSPDNYPIALTFARPKQGVASRWSQNENSALRDSDAETTCVTAESFERLGLSLNLDHECSSIVVGSFLSVPGIFQRSLTSAGSMYRPALDSINGEFVPSYATVQLVHNAIKRHWKAKSSMHILLCDDELKAWLKNNITAQNTES